MRQRTRSILIAAYVLACILLGGSAQGVWNTLLLQLCGIGLLFWAAIATNPAAGDVKPPALLNALLALFAVAVVLQLVPLPAEVWARLPGREALSEGLALVGEAGIALPISLSPYASVLALFAVIPGLALFVAARALQPSARWLAFAIAAGTVLSIALAALQIAAGPGSWSYFYPITSPGAVGPFANVNHFGTLLLAAIPFAVALLASLRGTRESARGSRWIVGIALLVLLAIGIGLNRSVAVLSLAAPVFIASLALLPNIVRLRSIALPVAAVALAAGVVLLASSPIASRAADGAPADSVVSRQQIWSITATAIGDTFPYGTGLGSFEEVYRQNEAPSEVSSRYVNHAHNDYLELILELGAAGALLIVLFLAWWAAAAWRIWTSPLSTPFERAATIASATVLAHSVVDYPLRTAAIASVFAVAIALMAGLLRHGEPARPDERRPPRHVKLG